MNPDGLNNLLLSGVVRGLGEVILRHSAYQLGSLNTIRISTREQRAGRRATAHSVVPHRRRTWRRGQRSSGSSIAGELERAIQAAPGTTFVWAHAGHGPASVLRNLLSRNSNLMADISARSPWLGPGTVLVRPDGVVIPEWSIYFTTSRTGSW